MGSYVHALFPEGLCSKSPCKTTKESIIWIGPDYSTQDQCRLYEQPFTSSISFANKTASYLSGTFYGNLPLSGSCNIHYCGSNGTRISSGIIVILRNYTLDVPKCPSDLNAGIVPEWLRDQ